MDQTTTKMKAWNIGIACGSALCLLLIFLAINQIKYLFQPNPPAPAATNTITVSGTGSVTAIPDIATFSFGVTETATTIDAAQTAATAKTNAAISALVSAGVATSDVQTLSYNINPHYETTNQPCVYNTIAPASGGSVSSGMMIPVCPGSKSTLTGYDVSETIQVKVRDISKAGSLFQTIGSLGVQNVNDLQFSIDDVESVQDQARANAISDARGNANKLADELGVHLGPIVSFSDNSGGNVPIFYSAKAMSATEGAIAPAPSIPEGQQKVTDNVSVTYEVR